MTPVQFNIALMIFLIGYFVSDGNPRVEIRAHLLGIRSTIKHHAQEDATIAMDCISHAILGSHHHWTWWDAQL